MFTLIFVLLFFLKSLLGGRQPTIGDLELKAAPVQVQTRQPKLRIPTTLRTAALYGLATQDYLFLVDGWALKPCTVGLGKAL